MSDLQWAPDGKELFTQYNGQSASIDLSAAEEIIELMPEGDESLITLLHALQSHYGYLPEEVLKIVCKKRGVFVSNLYRLASSYKAFHMAAPKKFKVSVCDGTGCHLKGSGLLLQKLEEKTAETNSRITLEKVRCLGYCDLSPAVVINGEIYGGADARAKILEILGE